jgi:hypothetical protein
MLRFEDQYLTSFSGLVIFQKLFDLLDLKDRLRRCFKHLTVSPIFGHASIVLLLIVHFLLGYRELRHLRYYADDPLVLRLLGLKRLPDVATVSRQLAAMDEQSVQQLQGLQQSLVLDRLRLLALSRITLNVSNRSNRRYPIPASKCAWMGPFSVTLLSVLWI